MGGQVGVDFFFSQFPKPGEVVDDPPKEETRLGYEVSSSGAKQDWHSSKAPSAAAEEEMPYAKWCAVLKYDRERKR